MELLLNGRAVEASFVSGRGSGPIRLHSPLRFHAPADGFSITTVTSVRVFLFPFFSQLLFGASDAEAAKLQLKRDPLHYHFLRQGGVAKVDSISDRTDYKNVSQAFRTLNFDPASVETIWKIVAAVLHLVRALARFDAHLTSSNRVPPIRAMRNSNQRAKRRVWRIRQRSTPWRRS